MMKRNLVLSVFASMLLVTGCSSNEKDLLFGGKQDPTADQDKNVQNGQPNPNTPVSSKPIPSEAIKIDTVSFYSFQEGQTGEFKVSARILIPDYTLDLQFKNLADFPGATYDSATGVFNWTPPTPFVSGIELYTDTALQIYVVASKKDDVVLYRELAVPIRVNRVLSTPDIVSANGVNSLGYIREGTRQAVTVEVKDPNASADPNTWPTLLITAPKSGQPSLSAFTSITKVSKNANGNIAFDLMIDLTDAEITKSGDTMGLGFKAVSAFNRVSTEKSFTIPVYTSLEDAKSTWNTTVDATIGATVDYQFMIMEPKSEGLLSLGSFRGLPTGADVTCKAVTDSMQTCRLLWNIPTTEYARTVYISVDAKVRNSYYSDSAFNQDTLYFYLRLADAVPTSQGELK